MHKLKLIYSLFILAALLFIAKPFFGFGLHQSISTFPKQNSLLVKAFAKRKPEYLEEANAKKATVSFQLNNPDVKLLATILTLLILLFPLGNIVKTIRHLLVKSVHTDTDIYLLTGQLII